MLFAFDVSQYRTFQGDWRLPFCTMRYDGACLLFRDRRLFSKVPPAAFAFCFLSN